MIFRPMQPSRFSSRQLSGRKIFRLCSWVNDRKRSPEDATQPPLVHDMKRTRSLDLDFERERYWAEIILASQDMMQVLMLLNDHSLAPHDDPRTMQASGAMVTTYCRPFTKNNRRVIHGKRWIDEFTAEEKALHARILRIRSTDIAHTEYRAGRVQIHIEEIVATVDGVPGEIRYSTRMEYQGLMQADLRLIAGMVSKIREKIESERKQEGEAILAARVAAGYRKWFTPGKRGHPDDLPA